MIFCLYALLLSSALNSLIGQRQSILPNALAVEGFEMVLVEGGTFIMGSNDLEADNDEQPTHQLELQDYYIGRYEVTQAQWRNIMGEDPEELYFAGCPECPVEGVSWNDVQVFIKRLNAKTGQEFRLPTEAEWEYAARGGPKSRGYRFSGSEDIGKVAWYDKNSAEGVKPVGQKQPNELEIYDMTGNVREWCSDWYARFYYEQSAQQNPHGPPFGSSRVARGGSWSNYSKYSRVANRFCYGPDYRMKGQLGFRLALDTIR